MDGSPSIYQSHKSAHTKRSLCGPSLHNVSRYESNEALRYVYQIYLYKAARKK